MTAEAPKEIFRVRMPTLGKAAITLNAETAEDAVRLVVEDYGRRAGEPPHQMARRLDRFAEVRGETGPPRRISVMGACPEPPAGLDEQIARETAEALIPAEEDLADEFRSGLSEPGM